MLQGKFASIFAISCSVAMADYSSGPEKKIAVVNAGSTGSRLYIYEYSLDPATRIPVIKKGASRKINGGVQNENEDSLNAYLQRLFGSVSKENINSIYFNSTAGMRQIRPDQRDSLNGEIEKWLKETFPLSTVEVETITGRKEGLYAWLTLNYNNSLIKLQGYTQGILDLGGASTQIAYEVDKDADFIVKISNRTYNLKAGSFLGLGINQAIEQYLNQESCFPLGFTMPNGRKGTGDYEACVEKIEPLITKVHKVNNYIGFHPPKNTHSFLAAAGFDYTASELGIRNNYSIKNLDEKGKAFCDRTWDDLKSGKTPYPVTHFLWHYCFDVAFERSLLTFGYHLDTSPVSIKTASSIGYDSDWSLGVLFSPFVTIPSNSKGQDKLHTDL